jgi:hypothetical protein
LSLFTFVLKLWPKRIHQIGSRSHTDPAKRVSGDPASGRQEGFDRVQKSPEIRFEPAPPGFAGDTLEMTSKHPPAAWRSKWTNNNRKHLPGDSISSAFQSPNDISLVPLDKPLAGSARPPAELFHKNFVLPSAQAWSDNDSEQVTML